jgi:hypothetical protein
VQQHLGSLNLQTLVKEDGLPVPEARFVFVLSRLCGDQKRFETKEQSNLLIGVRIFGNSIASSIVL